MSVIQNIGTEKVPLIANRVANAPDLSLKQARIESSGSGNSDQELVVRLSSKAIDVAKIQEAKDSFNDTAKTIRTADKALEHTNEYVEQMKASLNAIVKQYPPYPPGSEERVSYLRSFNAFRRLIDQLSLSSDPAQGKISEDIAQTAEGNS